VTLYDLRVRRQASGVGQVLVIGGAVRTDGQTAGFAAYLVINVVSESKRKKHEVEIGECPESRDEAMDFFLEARRRKGVGYNVVLGYA